jgi:predicted RNA-binding Zn-ribbon protein involved in translation (DUF1610 family)
MPSYPWGMMTPSQTDTSDEDLMTGRPRDADKGSALASRRSGKRGVKFCPKCGSTHIQWASGLPQLWSVWECKTCGYRGAFVVEDSELAERLREKFSKELKQDKPHIRNHKPVSEA